MGLKRNLHGISKAGVMEQSFIFKPKFGVGPGAIAVANAACLPADLGVGSSQALNLTGLFLLLKILFYNCSYLFIFYCAVSSLLHGPLSSCGAWASQGSGFYFCGTWALGCLDFRAWAKW